MRSRRRDEEVLVREVSFRYYRKRKIKLKSV